MYDSFFAMPESLNGRPTLHPAISPYARLKKNDEEIFETGIYNSVPDGNDHIHFRILLYRTKGPRPGHIYRTLAAYHAHVIDVPEFKKTKLRWKISTYLCSRVWFRRYSLLFHLRC